MFWTWFDVVEHYLVRILGLAVIAYCAIWAWWYVLDNLLRMLRIKKAFLVWWAEHKKTVKPTYTERVDMENDWRL